METSTMEPYHLTIINHLCIYIYIWVTYNISLTWIKAHLGMIPLTNHASSEGEQWGRYNLPRYIYIYVYQDRFFWYPAKKETAG